MNKRLAALRQYWERLSVREQVIAASCIGVLGLAFVIQCIVVPYTGYLADLQTQIEARQIKAVKYQRWLNAGATSGSTDNPLLESAGNESDDMSRFLKTMEQAAREAGVRIVDLKPIPADKQGIRQKVGVDLQITASLPALLDFLHRVRAAPELLEIHRFQINSGDGPSLRISFLITETFFLRQTARKKHL